MLRPRAVWRRVELRLLIRAAVGSDGVGEAELTVRLAVGGAHLVAHMPRCRTVAAAEVGHRYAGRADELVAEERHLSLHLEPQQTIARPRAVEVEREFGAVPVRVLPAVGVGGRLLPAATEGHGRVERRLLEGDEGPDATAGDGPDDDAPACSGAGGRHGRFLGQIRPFLED